jgi:hypothetical protein
MKAKFTCLFLLLAAPLLHAQATPNLMSYQGRVTDAAGVLIGNSAPVNRTVTFRLYAAASAGSALYAETQTVTISGGEFSVLIGNGAGVAGSPGPNGGSSLKSLSDIVNSGSYSTLYLGVTVDDGTAAADPEISPRQQMLSGAFALRAKVAESVVGGSLSTAMLADQAVSTAKIAPGAVDSGRILDGTIVASDISNNTITATKLDTTTVGLWTPSGNSIYRNSNVGIGESNPGFPLNFGNSVGDKISLANNAGNTYGFGIQSGLLQIHTDGVGADIGFGYGSSASMTETLRIKGNGNVGIGTSTPGEKLVVAGNVRATSSNNPCMMVSSPSTQGYLAIATTAGSWSSAASPNDVVLRSDNAKVILQSGGSAAGIIIDTNNNITVPNTLAVTSLSAGNGLFGSAASSTFRVGAGALGTGAGSEIILGSLGCTTNNTMSLGISAYRFTTGSDWGSSSILLGMNVDNTVRVGGGYLSFGSNGMIGIGTPTPGAPLHVGSTTNFSVNTNAGVASNSGNYLQEGNSDVYSADGTKGVNSAAVPISIYSAGGVMAQFVVMRSDERIKDIVNQSAPAEDLQLLNQLKVTNYHMKDRIVNGTTLYKGLVAQQVREVMPEAVSQSSDYLPDIYARAAGVDFDAETHQLTLRMAKPHRLVAGEWVRIHLAKGIVESEVLEVPSTHSLVVAAQEPVTAAFVYGRRVDDVLAVNYDRVFTTGIGAIQELSRKLEDKDAQIANLEARLSALEKRLPATK